MNTNESEILEALTRPEPHHREAGGIAHATLVTERGGTINLTARADTLEQALDAIMRGIDYASNKYGMAQKWRR